jgi:hypothetical protein
MNVVQSLLQFLQSLLTWWFVVEAWEQAVRVRLGKNVLLLGPGVHLRIPYFDRFYVQNIRTRMMPISDQTISTLDGKPITLCGSLRYRVADVLKLYQSLHMAEMTIKQEAAGWATKFIVEHNMKDCTPKALQEYVSANISLEKWGIADGVFVLTDFVAGIRTYRLLNGSLGAYSGDTLSTQRAASTSTSQAGNAPA